MYPEIRQRIEIPDARASVNMKYANNKYILYHKIKKLQEEELDHFKTVVPRLCRKVMQSYIKLYSTPGVKIHWPFHYKMICFNDEGKPYTEDHNIYAPVLMMEPSAKLEDPCAVAIGPIIQTKPKIANYRSNTNWFDGMRKRMIHDVEYNEETMIEFSHFVRRLVTKYEPLEYFPICVETQNKYWLDPCKHYTVAQKNKHRKNMKLFEEIGMKNYKKHFPDLYSCLSFIKREFYDTVKTARIINSRTDEFKSIVGAHMKRIEEVVCINEHYVKHISLSERAERMKQIFLKYHYVTEDDYSSFEGTQTNRFHRACERWLFKHMLRNNKEMWKFIKPIFNVSFKETSISMPSKQYKDRMTFSGSRMSGDLWTSLGNGFSNECVFLFAIYKLTSIIKPPTPIDFDYLVEGDDGFFAATVDFTHVFESVATELGLQCKIEQGRDINDVSFCSTCIGPNGQSVPNFWRLLEKFGWDYDEQIVNNYSDKPSKHESKILYSKALSLNAVSQGIPILQELSMQIIRTVGKQQLMMKYFSYLDLEVYDMMHYEEQETEITMEMRQFFEERFGVTITTQLNIEEYIRRQKKSRYLIPLYRPTQETLELAKINPAYRQ